MLKEGRYPTGGAGNGSPCEKWEVWPFPGGPCEAISSGRVPRWPFGVCITAAAFSIYPGAPQALLLEKENPHSEPHSEGHIILGRTWENSEDCLAEVYLLSIPPEISERAAEEEARRQQEEAEERAGQEALRGTIGRSAPRTVDNFPRFLDLRVASRLLMPAVTTASTTDT